MSVRTTAAWLGFLVALVTGAARSASWAVVRAAETGGNQSLPVVTQVSQATLEDAPLLVQLFGCRTDEVGDDAPDLLALGRLDGTIVHHYTRSGHCLGAAWSPDGTRIAFTYVGEFWDSAGLYLMNADGSQLTRLVAGYCVSLSWSPDGNRIAYAAYVPMDSDQLDIYVVDLGSRKVDRLTRSRADEDDPTWSPDGTQIAFYSSRSGYGDIYVVDLVTGHERRLTSSNEFERGPAWSPSGQTVAVASWYDIWMFTYSYSEKQWTQRYGGMFSSKDEDRCSMIEIIDGEKGEVLRIISPVPDPGHSLVLTWSPDGRTLAQGYALLDLVTGQRQRLPFADMSGGAPVRCFHTIWDWRRDSG